MENKEAIVDEKDYFSRLPEELIVCILNKVSDLKSLCRCSVVSKNLASLIPHVTTITLTLPSRDSFLVQIYKERRQARYHGATQQFRPQSSQREKMPQFVEKFRRLESIFLEYIRPSNNGANKLLRWKAKWSKTWMTLVALLPASVHKKTDPEPAPDQEQPIVISRRDDCVWLAVCFFFEWWFTLYFIVRSHSSVRSVTITDSERRGTLIARDEQLVGVERKSFRKLFLSCSRNSKTGLIPFLELPLSGYLMSDVCLLIMRTGKDGMDADQDYDDILAWDFGEEEKVFGEAVKEILKHHRYSFQSYSP